MRLNLLLRQLRNIKDPMKPKPFTVIVEGNVGSGKSTFLNYFKKFENVEIINEPIELWQNFYGHNLLSLQYEDPSKWTSTLQSYVQLTMLNHHLQDTIKPVKLIERSIYSARHCFVEQMMRSETLSEPSGLVLNEWFKWMCKNLEVGVDLVVYLKTTPDIAYKRIIKRNRDEEKFVPFEYISSLHAMHENWFSKPELLPAPAITLNADLDLNVFQDELISYVPYILNQKKMEVSVNV